ncbi:MAG: hypothetical protein Q9M32_08115 [Sulfurimonas sp.]|nr:hypothetical protein [Sulfurimonas sp.]
MRLENILALTNGKLVNDPFVKKFDTIVFEAKAVKRGDLFIAFDDTMIEEAVRGGAYGIVFDKPTQITDTEIAWVKVNSCEDSLIKLLRFTLIEKNVTIYECNEIVLKLSLQVITDPNFIPVHGDIKEIHKQLSSIENESTLLFCPQLCDATLFTDIKKIPLEFSNTISIMEQTLFETSFIHANIFYERQLISPFFMPYLEELLYLYKILDVNFRLRKFTPLNHFEAVFVSNKFEIKEFGTSDKVLIFEQNASLIESEMNFLQKNASWANLIYIVPASLKIEPSENIFIYKNINKIKEILRANSFNFALIAGADTSILTKPTVNHTQLTLDF